MADIARRSFLQGVVGAAVVAPAALAGPVTYASEPTMGEASLGELRAGTLRPERAYPYKWRVSLDGGEVYNEEYETREEAAKAALEQGGGIVAECKQQEYNFEVAGYEVVDLLANQNEELAGEDGFDLNLTPEQERELGEVVTQAIQEWAYRHKLDVTAWQFADVRSQELVGIDPNRHVGHSMNKSQDPNG